VTATPSTYLSIVGLALDFVGAAFLAYDALYGPEARLQASIRRDRIQHEHRVHRNAVVGLVLLMAGFACQGLANVLTLTITVVPIQP
jgi:hypothetical protein